VDRHAAPADGGAEGEGGDGDGDGDAAAFPPPPGPPPTKPPRHARPGFDVLLGCTKCRYLRGGCGSCRARPPATRRADLRWRPGAGRPQAGALPAGPTFHPTEEEFRDPVAFIQSIRAAGEAAGAVCIVPPPSWDPPFALERGTNGACSETFRFAVRRQLTSHLCKRPANTKTGGPASFKYGRVDKGAAGATGGADAAAADGGGDGGGGGAAPAPSPDKAAADADASSSSSFSDSDFEDGDGADGLTPDGEFAFTVVGRTHTLRSFNAAADWAKARHFSDPPPGPPPAGAEGSGPGGAARRPAAAGGGWEPTLEAVEAEYWRVVEDPDATVPAFYGQDLDSGHHGSGFPLPPLRRRLLAAHLAATAPPSTLGAGVCGGKKGGFPTNAAAVAAASAAPPSDPTCGGLLRPLEPDEAAYAAHPWNINNLPRCAGSVLRHVPGDDLITGVMVPWLYVGSALSSFCWHIEDHGLCSINYLHAGCPKVWYTVPAGAAGALEAAVADAVPHLVKAAPKLLYQLVTMVPPADLAARGVPVHRLVHRAGSFVLTFPNAYHAGLNTGTNCAEAVNFGPSFWVPWGSVAAAHYRWGKPLTFSHDALLVALTRAARSRAPPGVANARDRADADAAAAASRALKDAAARRSAGVAAAAAAAAASAADAGAAPVTTTAAGRPVRRTRRALAALEAEREEAEGGGGCGAPGPASPAAARPGSPGPTRPDLRLGVADPAARSEVPLLGLQLGAAELAVRLDEEVRRRAAGAAAAGGPPGLPAARMAGGRPGARRPDDGTLADGEEADCATCLADLWLSAVVSPDVPGTSVCPEHAADLGVPPARQRLIFRHSLEELAGLVADAGAWVPGAAAAVAAARARAARPPPGVQARVLGALSQDTALARKRAAAQAGRAARRAARRAAKAAAAVVVEEVG